jgi:hypothetical protein
MRGPCVSNMPILSLPPDVISYVILPMLLSEKHRTCIQLIAAQIYVNLCVPSISEDLLNAFKNVYALAKAHPDFQHDVQRWCKVNIDDALRHMITAHEDNVHKNQYINTFTNVKDELLRTRKRIPPSYVNDGCLQCGKWMPSYWPMLACSKAWQNPNMKKETQRNISLANRKLYRTMPWVKTGCCSTSCYMTYYRDIYDEAPDVYGIYKCIDCSAPLLASNIIGFNLKETHNCYCSTCRSDLYQQSY